MDLRTKILGGYGLILVLTMVVGIWAPANLYRLGRAGEAILRENYRSIWAAEQMLAALERQDSALLASLLGPNGGDNTETFRANEMDFLQWLGRAHENVTLEGEAEVLAEIQAAYSRFLEHAVPVLEAKTGATDVADYYENVYPAFLDVHRAAVRLRDLNQEAMQQASLDTQRMANRAMLSTAVVGLVALAFGGLFSIWLARRLTRPLQAMIAATEQIATGNYDVHIPVASSDELGRLAEQINDMSRRLEEYRRLNIGQLIAEEQRNEAILSSISDGVILVDDQGTVVKINREAADIFGTTPTQAQGRHFFEVTGQEKLYQHVRQCLERNCDLELSEEEATIAIGQEDNRHYFRFFVSPVVTAEDEMLGVVVLLQDVTNLKELDRLKSEFVMVVSHELRTPLTSVGMSLHLLEEDLQNTLTPRQRELLRAANEDVARLKALVNDLLDLSRIETGHISMELAPVPISLLTERAVLPLLPQAEEKGVALENKAGDNTESVMADANKVTWVLTNLIANALRYTDAGGHVGIEARTRGGWAYITVRDDGAGIPFKYQAKIFDKFVQVSNSGTAGGAGLGLAISKEIVKAHGGTIWVDSAPGRGSAFTFTLPLAEKPNPQE
ncbi:MAG: HAMP domain-containing protein [Caldilineae bacterium]|nr:MAG: HAMP domain-containing protein [Caldilineae bacterium]